MSVRDSEHEDESEYTKADKKDNTVEIVVVFNPGLRFAGQVGGPPSADAGAQFVTQSAHFNDPRLYASPHILSLPLPHALFFISAPSISIAIVFVPCLVAFTVRDSGGAGLPGRHWGPHSR